MTHSTVLIMFRLTCKGRLRSPVYILMHDWILRNLLPVFSWATLGATHSSIVQVIIIVTCCYRCSSPYGWRQVSPRGSFLALEFKARTNRQPVAFSVHDLDPRRRQVFDQSATLHCSAMLSEAVPWPPFGEHLSSA